VSPVASWLAGRRPAPSADLAAALSLADARGALDEVLAAEAARRLAAARARLGRVRESAFRLLEADALITYACEAALEREDPEDALRRLLVSTGA
jgi:hypothetical protein